MNYGLPYKGSKNLIAPWVVECLPAADTLVDLFAGGCAVTHAAMCAHKFRRYIINDIERGITLLFERAVRVAYHDETRWVSREEYFAEKDTDPFVRYCWSFGNNGRDYLYSRTIEPYKRAVHYAVVFDDWRDFNNLCPEAAPYCHTALSGLTDTRQRRVTIGRATIAFLKASGDPSLLKNPLYASSHFRGGKGARSLERLQSLESLQSLERLQSLESLESLERLERLQSLESLESLQSLESLECLQSDYADVPIPEGATVYADPPYKGTDGYGEQSFDHERFYDWLRRVPFPVYVSEYAMPDDFIIHAEKRHASRLSHTTTRAVTERIFVHRRWRDVRPRLTLFD